MRPNETRLAIMFGAWFGSGIARWFGPLLTWFGFAILAGHPFGLIAYALLGAWWWLRGPRAMPWAALSRGWKINLYAHAGCGSAGAGAALLCYYAPHSLALGGAMGILAGLFQAMLGLGLAGYSLWYWIRVHRHIRPVFAPTEPILSSAGMERVADVAAAASSSLTRLDDVPPAAPMAASGPTTGHGGGTRTTFHRGSGEKIEIGPDGRVYVSGKFIGHRDAQGRITDGSGKFTGTLKSDGAVHGANGDYLGRVF